MQFECSATRLLQRVHRVTSYMFSIEFKNVKQSAAGRRFVSSFVKRETSQHTVQRCVCVCEEILRINRLQRRAGGKKRQEFSLI